MGCISSKSADEKGKKSRQPSKKCEKCDKIHKKKCKDKKDDENNDENNVKNKSEDDDSNDDSDDKNRKRQEEYAERVREALKNNPEFREMNDVAYHITAHHEPTIDDSTQKKIVLRVVINEFRRGSIAVRSNEEEIEQKEEDESNKEK